MFIARQLRNKNRAEYLLYMWQVEDIIRAHHCDIEALRNGYLSQFDLTAEERKELEEWYENLCVMLKEEGKTLHGHLQINKNVLESLSETHNKLLSSSQYPYYRELYYKVLPYIVELRAKKQEKTSGGNEKELETCFEFLYGVMLLRFQKKEVFPETQNAAKDVSALLGQLSDYWKKDQEGQLFDT